MLSPSEKRWIFEIQRSGNVFIDAADRDYNIPNATNGMECFLLSTSYPQRYDGAGWRDMPRALPVALGDPNIIAMKGSVATNYERLHDYGLIVNSGGSRPTQVIIEFNSNQTTLNGFIMYENPAGTSAQFTMAVIGGGYAKVIGADFIKAVLVGDEVQMTSLFDIIDGLTAQINALEGRLNGNG